MAAENVSGYEVDENSWVRDSPQYQQQLRDAVAAVITNTATSIWVAAFDHRVPLEELQDDIL